jgi:hypothetical protein
MLREYFAHQTPVELGAVSTKWTQTAFGIRQFISSNDGGLFPHFKRGMEVIKQCM